MQTILVTGVSGFLGSRLAAHLAPNCRVIGMSRKTVADGLCEHVRGDFASFEDLRKLDGMTIDAVVHLAGETGGTSEEAGLSANVLGTRRLLRYLSDRGCRKFVLASSIAVTGCLHPDFTPAQLPLPPDHPCLARDAYGLSKAMLESLAGYFGRSTPASEFTCLRFGWVMYSSRPQMPWCDSQQPIPLPFLYLGQVTADDVLAGITTVLQAPVRPGSHTYNLVGPDVRSRDNVAHFIRAALGERARHLDTQDFEATGASCRPVYSMQELFNDYGFRPAQSVCMA